MVRRSQQEEEEMVAIARKMVMMTLRPAQGPAMV
jgi:hypothetical protein